MPVVTRDMETCFSWVYAVWETRDTGLIVDKSLT